MSAPYADDLARKCADDVGAAIGRTAALLEVPEDRFFVALAGTAAAAGQAVGYAEQARPDSSAEEAADALWLLLRPMILLVAGERSTDFRALLRQAPRRAAGALQREPR